MSNNATHPTIAPCPYCGSETEIAVYDGQPDPMFVACRCCTYQSPRKCIGFDAIAAHNALCEAVTIGREVQALSPGFRYILPVITEESTHHPHIDERE